MYFVEKILWVSILLCSLVSASEVYLTDQRKVPEISMPDNNLSFTLIEGYQAYKVMATHYRSDKNEIRYILINPIGYNALNAGAKVLPEGTKIVKIGWSTRKMSLFPAAIEADRIQRVEYMVKASKRFDHDGDHWGYARFVRGKEGFKAWDKGTQSCISCHRIAKESDYVFTTIQKRLE